MILYKKNCEILVVSEDVEKQWDDRWVTEKKIPQNEEYPGRTAYLKTRNRSFKNRPKPDEWTKYFNSYNLYLFQIFWHSFQFRMIFPVIIEIAMKYFI